MPPWAPWGGPSKRRGTTMGESTSSPARKVRTRRPMSWSGPQPKHWWKRLPGSVYRISSREPNTGSNGAGSAGPYRTGFLSDGIGHIEVFLEKGLPGDEGARRPAPLFGPVVPASETYRVSPPRMGGRALRLLGRHDPPLQRQSLLRCPGKHVVVAGIGCAEIPLGVGMRADQERHALGHVGSEQIGAGFVMAARVSRARRDRRERITDLLLRDGIPPHVVEQGGEKQLLVGTRALRQLGALQRVRQLVDPLLSVLARGGRAHGVHQPIGHRSHVMKYTQRSVVHHPQTGQGDA